MHAKCECVLKVESKEQSKEEGDAMSSNRPRISHCGKGVTNDDARGAPSCCGITSAKWKALSSEPNGLEDLVEVGRAETSDLF